MGYYLVSTTIGIGDIMSPIWEILPLHFGRHLEILSPIRKTLSDTFTISYWTDTVSYLGDTVSTIFGRHLEENSTFSLSLENYFGVRGGGGGG